MNSESLRIADQLRRAFTGDPWHGSPLRDILAGITADQAHTRPLPSAHSIWELVLHIDIYAGVALEATQGLPMPKLYQTKEEWPVVSDSSETAWTQATDQLFQTVERLVQTIDAFEDTRLEDTVPGRNYDFYYLFHGIVQHSLYHGGQISLLKRAVNSPR